MFTKNNQINSKKVRIAAFAARFQNGISWSWMNIRTFVYLNLPVIDGIAAA